MSELDDVFFAENIVDVNKSIFKILFFTIFVGPVFILFKALGIFGTRYDYSLYLLLYSSVFTFIQYLIIRKKNLQVVGMYTGLIFCCGYAMNLAMYSMVNATVSVAIVPFMSCLYYNKKLTNTINGINYVLIIFAFYIRSTNIQENVTYTNYYQNSTSRFFAYAIGLSMEMFFLFLATHFLSARTHKTHTHVLDLAEEKSSLLNEVQESNKQLRTTQYEIIKFVAECLGSHDLFTGRHIMHTQVYVKLICKELRKNGFYTDILTDEEIEIYTNAAFLHDIGKLHIPEGILNKPGKFTDEEFKLMKCHPEEGKKLLSFLPQIEDGHFNEIAKEMAYSHHEKWNGSGYPLGLKGDEIPLCARIMAGADVLDALISQRLYKSPMNIDAAIKVFEESKNTHFEECIAQAVINNRNTIVLLDRDFKEKEDSSNQTELKWWLNYHNSLVPEQK